MFDLDQISQFAKAIQSRNVRLIGNLLELVAGDDRPGLVRPALIELAQSDPDSVTWFIRSLMTDGGRKQLKEGIHSATVAHLQESGFRAEQDYWQTPEELVLSPQVMPYLDSDPFGQVLVKEFCRFEDTKQEI